jgi:signal transduction histidine kinase
MLADGWTWLLPRLSAMPDPLRILIIDGSPDDAELMIRHLRVGGFDPAAKLVDHETAIVVALEHGNWDVILCDNHLPGLAAGKAFEIIRSRAPEVPLILVSGTIGEEAVAELMRRGAADVILKDNASMRLAPVVRRELAVADAHRRSVQAIEAQTRELQRSNADLEMFASIAAHDLQEPLNLIAGYSQLLAAGYHGRLDDNADRYLDRTLEGVRHMQRLIADLLAYARVTGHGEPPQPTAVEAVVGAVLKTMERRIEETGAQVLCGVLPTVNADEGRLSQVFQNLIGNAIKFRSERPPCIRIEARHQQGEWLFSVADNGVGIEMRHAERVFQMFQRGNPPSGTEGTGIGLAIAKRIVERHHGRIWLTSEPGQGTTFFFTLPRIDAAAEPAPELLSGPAVSSAA